MVVVVLKKDEVDLSIRSAVSLGSGLGGRRSVHGRVESFNPLCGFARVRTIDSRDETTERFFFQSALRFR